MLLTVKWHLLWCMAQNWSFVHGTNAVTAEITEASQTGPHLSMLISSLPQSRSPKLGMTGIDLPIWSILIALASNPSSGHLLPTQSQRNRSHVFSFWSVLSLITTSPSSLTFLSVPSPSSSFLPFLFPLPSSAPIYPSFASSPLFPFSSPFLP